MGKIYKNQTSLTLKLETGVDVSTAPTKQIKYRKPNGVEGALTAILEGTTILKYDFTSTPILDVAGAWLFWAYVIFTDSRIGVGEPAEVVVYEPGN